MKGHGSIFSLAVTFWSVVVKAQGILDGFFIYAEGWLSSDAKSLELPFTDASTHGEVNVEIGSPGRQYKLLFDPGSSNTWVGAQKKYEETSTSTKTGDAVAVAYGSGKFSGEE